MGRDRAVEVPLVELRAEVVALEVRENVAYEERLSQRELQRREARAVLDLAVEGRGGGKQAVEAAGGRVVAGLDIRHPPVVLQGEIREVALGAADGLHNVPAGPGRLRLPVGPRLKVVEEIEFQ